jgi:hypothetical protein
MIAIMALKAASGFLLAFVMVNVSMSTGEVVVPSHDGITAMSQLFTCVVLAEEAIELMPQAHPALMATRPEPIE